MPVRDAGPYLDAAIESILAQTFGDFEFIIRDDGSRDGSTEALRRWAARDSRIRLFEDGHALGPAASSNWVVRQAAAPLVARMDADDVSHPERLQRQLAVLEAAPDACLVASLWEGIDPHGRRVRPRDRWRLTRPGPFAPFPHGSIMFRREAFERAGGYRAECNYWEDADLYLRLAELGPLLVLPEPLYFHRSSVLSTRLVSPPEQVERAVDKMYRTLSGAPTAGGGERRRILPRVYVSLGSTRLWAGDRTAMLARLWRRGELGWNAHSLAVLAWALWGAVSPRSLRFALTLLIRARDHSVRNRYRDGEPCAWRPTLDAAAAAAAAEAPPQGSVSEVNSAA